MPTSSSTHKVQGPHRGKGWGGSACHSPLPPSPSPLAPPPQPKPLEKKKGGINGGRGQVILIRSQNHFLIHFFLSLIFPVLVLPLRILFSSLFGKLLPPLLPWSFSLFLSCRSVAPPHNPLFKPQRNSTILWRKSAPTCCEFMQKAWAAVSKVWNWTRILPTEASTPWIPWIFLRPEGRRR